MKNKLICAIHNIVKTDDDQTMITKEVTGCIGSTINKESIVRRWLKETSCCEHVRGLRSVALHRYIVQRLSCAVAKNYGEHVSRHAASAFAFRWAVCLRHIIVAVICVWRAVHVLRCLLTARRISDAVTCLLQSFILTHCLCFL